jgi:hypothetical protein
MKKSLADSRDFNAGRRQSFSWRKVAYKVGSPMKGCYNCGDYDLITVGRRTVKQYTSGFDVWRSYCPSQTEWTYYCYECSAKDYKAWENAKDVGEEPIRGTAEAKAYHRRAARKSTTRVHSSPLSKDQLDRLAKSVAHIFKKGE